MRMFVILLMFVLGSFVSNVATAQELSTPDNIVIELPTFDDSPTTSATTPSTSSITGVATISSSNLRGRIGCGVKRVRTVGSSVVGKAKGVVATTRSAVQSGVSRVLTRGKSVVSRSADVASTVASRGRGRVRRVLSRVRGILRR